MRVVITGGAGFIGSHLVDHYLNCGHELIVIDSLITGREENIKTHLNSSALQFLNMDVCNVSDVEGKVDLILHFASPASPFDYLKYPIETMKTASFGTYNMLELARKKNAKILLASTSEVYGDPEVHPQKEDYWGNVNPIGPRSVYDEGKRFAEAMTISYHRKFGIKTNIVRIFNTYGERMRSGDGRVIPTFITEALKNKPLPIFGDGKQTRSFCYISDMVQGIMRMAQIDYAMPVNLGNPLEYTVLELADIVKQLCSSTSTLEFLSLPENDPRKRKPDIRRAKELLGWEPQVELKQGLKKVIDWFRSKND
ncbi:NAD-dependent dehydratase [candidate division TA06 bacterium DG_78]|uniref:NAD-dependent dehydratase n=1 Tax=candidate division TA06 bacterium DG_78 TaxID=1703772 RepID=A0A0S7YCH9_UNCT6|nr:MAG: NAD-dependent dehydratase [candidate division TA06 bacterium DG_78]